MMLDGCGPFAADEIDDMLARFLGEPNVQALATLPAGASVETVGDVRVTEKRRRNSGLVGVAQPRLVRRVITTGLR